MVIYAIDPALYHIGIVRVDTEKQNIKFDILNLKQRDDLADLYKELRLKYKNSLLDGNFYFIEDVVFYPIRSRKAQAQVWASIAILLSLLPSSAGYLLVSPHKVKKLVYDCDKLKKFLNTYNLIFKSEEIEHVVDAFRVLLVGLNETKNEKVVDVLKIYELI